MSSRFADYLDEFKSSNPQIRYAATQKFKIQCEKEISEMLSDPRQQMIQDIETFMKSLIQSNNEFAQISIAQLILLLIQQKVPLINSQKLEEFSLQLASDKKRNVLIQGAFCIQQLSRQQESRQQQIFDQSWNKIFEMMKNQQTKQNAAVLATNIIQVDSQSNTKIQQNSQFIQDVWSFIQETNKDKEMNKLAIDCYCQILSLKNVNQAFNNLLLSFQPTNVSQSQQILLIQNSLLIIHNLFDNILNDQQQNKLQIQKIQSHSNFQLILNYQQQQYQNDNYRSTIKHQQLNQIISDNYVNLMNYLICASAQNNNKQLNYLKDKEVIKEIGQIIPHFAKFNLQLFIENNFLELSLDFLLEKSGDKNFNILIIIGQLVQVVGQGNIRPYFPKIINVLLVTINPDYQIDQSVQALKDTKSDKSQNTKKPKGETDFNAEALMCINSLAQAAPELLSEYIEQLLNVMFSQGLSHELICALNTLASNLNHWIQLIEERLLQLVGLELLGLNILLLESMLNINFSQNKDRLLNYQVHQPKTQLALETLCQFKFSNFHLTNFCQDCLIKYVNSQQNTIRINAAKAILMHLIKDGSQQNIHAGDANQFNFSNSYVIVNNILSQVLIIGLTDADDLVREQIVITLNITTKYDQLLSQKDNLDVLFIGVNDNNFVVRSNIVSIIGRLSKIHPVIVLPHVREILLGLLFELDYSQDQITKIENVKLLLTIIKFCSQLINPFIKQVCKSILNISEQFIQKQHNNEELINSCLICLQELFNKSGNDVLEYIEQVISVTIYLLQTCNSQDQSQLLLKQQSLYCLIELSNGTGLPVVPYFINTQLLDLLLSIIKQDVSLQIQKLAAKTLVIVGALDYQIANKINKYDLKQLIMYKQINIDQQFDPLKLFKQQQVITQQLVSHGPGQIDKITDQIIDKNQIIKIENKEVIIQKQNQFIDYINITLSIIKNMFCDIKANEQYFNELIIIFRKLIQYLQNKMVTQQNNQIVEDIILQIFVIIEQSNYLVSQEHYLTQLIYIISSLNAQIRSYLEQVFILCYKLFDKQELTQLVLALMEEVMLKFPGYDFIQQNSLIVQKLLEYYSNCKIVQMQQFSQQIMQQMTKEGAKPETQISKQDQMIIRSYNTLVILLPSLKNQIKILLPCLLRIAQNWQNKQLCVATLDCIGRICCTCQIQQIQSSLIQTLLKIMQQSCEYYKLQIIQYANSQTQNLINNQNNTQNNYYININNSSYINHYKLNICGYKAFETLHYVALQLNTQFNTFVPVVNKIITDCFYYSPIFNVIVTINLRNNNYIQNQNNNCNYIILLKFVQKYKEQIYKLINNACLSNYLISPIRNSVLNDDTLGSSQSAASNTYSSYNQLNNASNQQMNNITFQLDIHTEKLLEMVQNQPQTVQFQQLEPQAPNNIGVEALPDIQQDNQIEIMPKKDWLCDDLEDTIQWRKWLNKLQISLIKHSPVEVIRYFYQLSLINQKISRELFNYSYFCFISDNNLTTEMRTTVNSTLRNSLQSKTIPKDIVQQLLDLIEFLEHNGENMITLLNDVRLGDISEQCYAYARSLRYRENEYQTAPQSTMDILVRVNKRLNSHESSKGVIYIELQRLNQTSISLLFDIMMKKNVQYIQEIKKEFNAELLNNTEMLINVVKNQYAELLKEEIKNIKIITLKHQKQLGDGTIGGIYVEGRPVFAGQRSKIMRCDYQQIAEYLVKSLKKDLHQKFQQLIEQTNIQFNSNQLYQTIEDITNEMIYQSIQYLKEPMTLNFGPKPQWFESLNWYDQALNGYNEQLNTLESVIGLLDGTKLKEALKQQQQLYYQKISCLYHLGRYQDVIQQADRYQIVIFQLKQFDLKKQQQTVDKFNVYIAKYCIQSLIEINDENGNEDIQKWLNYLDQASSQKSLIQVIYLIQQNKLQLAEKQTNELIEQIMSPIIAGTLESYERAYDNIIQLHQVIELQEVIKYKLLIEQQQEDNKYTITKQQLQNKKSSLFQITHSMSIQNIVVQSNFKKMSSFLKLPSSSDQTMTCQIQKYQLKSIWTRRLANVQQDLDTWIGILRVRQLVIDKSEDLPIYVSFALKCMNAGRQSLAKNTLESLLHFDHKNQLHIQKIRQTKQFYLKSNNFEILIPVINSDKYEVVYTYSKYLYQEGQPVNKIAAFVYLLRLAKDIQQNITEQPNYIELLQRIFIRMAEWYAELISVVRNEAEMISIGQSTFIQQNDFHVINESAIQGVFTNLQKLNEECKLESISSVNVQQNVTEVGVQQHYLDTSIEKVVGNAILDVVQNSEHQLEKQEWDNAINGFVDAKYALSWFIMAEQQNKENIQVQRCISHTSGYIVDLINNFEVKQNKTAEEAKSSSSTFSSLPSNTNDGAQLLQKNKVIGELNSVSQRSQLFDTSQIDFSQLHRHKIQYLKQSLISHFRCMKHKDIQLPSALRLLTLWFQYGTDSEIEDEVIRGLAALDVDVWLEVVPQLIARSTSSSRKIKYLIQQLLIQIGLKHPQTLVYPLLVATKRDQINQQSEALSVLDQIRRAHQSEVDQCLAVGGELVRVAITWPEGCMDGLFNSIIQYNQDKDATALMNAIAILMQQYENAPETPSEQQFLATYYEYLKQGWDSLKKGVLHNDLQQVDAARTSFQDCYNLLKNDVSKQFIVEMAQASPVLNSLRGSAVQLPGSSGEICINRFLQRMNVIASKQRPRKIAILASDGEIYGYLLKGREDLRQDERVMQLMGLINQLLQQDQFALRHQLHVTRYPCLPIGRNSGLLFWVPRSDTVNDLVKNYRLAKNFQDNSEDKQLMQRASLYSQLSLQQKLDAFKFVAQFCPALDLRTVFWEQATSSENWLARRTCFTASLAVMSMVGYILGLGDRHPANIMINRQTGQVLHIDYGDCFEACQRRARLPEKVPFRLTRILINAMEVCGVYGLYQKACEVTMRVLRNNKDSILAILQTFIYDPLLGWQAVHGSGVEPQTEAHCYRDDEGLVGVSPFDVVRRIEAKLTGRDFENYESLTIEQQVQVLMLQAQNVENLCQHYMGWCPMW